MVQTGPVVTLQVAKFGASYHGVGALLNRPPTTESLLRGSRHKEQMKQRNRQLYRSNPNMTADVGLQGGEESDDLDGRGNIITSVSSFNLCTDTFHREYLTLPNPKPKDRVVSELSQPQQTFKMPLSPSTGPSSYSRTIMRQAVSQENLCMDSEGPLLDKRQNTWGQRDHISSFPIRSSVSAHDLLSNHSSPFKQQQSSHKSTAGVWRTPFSQRSTPTPSIHPIRIDIPVTRAVSAPSNPPLTTFQQSSSLMQVKPQALKTKQSPQVSHIYASPLSATNKPAQDQVLWQQQTSTTRGARAEKPKVSITPTKHVSFQELPSGQKTTGPVQQRDHQQLCDPWRREAQEKLQQQGRLQAVQLLHKEVQLLQAKAKRTTEENERLRRLDLERQFQMRLQEAQRRGEEEEEEDEELDMMVILQQLGNKTEKNRCSGGNNWEQKEQTGSHLSHTEDKEQRADGVKHNDIKENQEDRLKKTSAPERLPFRERQRLFTLASSA